MMKIFIGLLLILEIYFIAETNASRPFFTIVTSSKKHTQRGEANFDGSDEFLEEKSSTDELPSFQNIKLVPFRTFPQQEDTPNQVMTVEQMNKILTKLKEIPLELVGSDSAKAVTGKSRGTDNISGSNMAPSDVRMNPVQYVMVQNDWRETASPQSLQVNDDTNAPNNIFSQVDTGSTADNSKQTDPRNEYFFMPKDRDEYLSGNEANQVNQNIQKEVSNMKNIKAGTEVYSYPKSLDIDYSQLAPVMLSTNVTTNTLSESRKGMPLIILHSKTN